ncbi:hypothetical protein E4K67_20415 [Desulfosporosinus fructosivorans]|uniref:Uncharacterized protein n=1 Tax=Desulfosporosinus fructosivorans TaxID=2018669 RepID=A0A4Z0QZT8_9FIRM|nr:hypothetical protein E4K67_20415 [Desulfosporosinus fructosivorans]
MRICKVTTQGHREYGTFYEYLIPTLPQKSVWSGLELATKLLGGVPSEIPRPLQYDDEPATIAALDGFAIENGFIIDIDDTRRHHEIYISDPRKIAPGKLKTVLRHPIRSA